MTKERKEFMKRVISLTLVVIMCFTVLVGCNQPQGEPESMLYTEHTTLGNGKTEFSLVVEHIDGTEVNFTIKTDKTILADALLEVGIVEGSMGTYGLYIKRVNGISHIYENDQTYWALYENDGYAQNGVSSTTIDTSVTYKLKASK